jgi:ribonucleoside-diphosphate reductase alpha chain
VTTTPTPPSTAPNGRKLDQLYRLAWHLGCKTTYYLRLTSATHVEKSTLRGTDGRLNAVSPVGTPESGTPATPSPAAVARAGEPLPLLGEPSADALACSIDNPDCEACQ